MLKPGGRFLCLEFSRPPPSRCARPTTPIPSSVIPEIGRLVANDREAYQYLVESIRRFPDQAALAGMMRQAGFGQVGWTNYTGGVAALHHGWAV